MRVISQTVIGRLPRYLRYLGELKDEGIERVSSSELSELMNVTASQIRQDFNNFGGFGQQGYGYNVEYLYEEIAKILGLYNNHNIIIVGAGNLGQALANYTNFQKRGFIIKGIFDISEKIIGERIGDFNIQSIDNIPDFVINNEIDIAVLTLPKDGAVRIADTLVKNGIKAILNFAHVDLELPSDVVVENVHLSESLMKLSYKLNENREKNNGKEE